MLVGLELEGNETAGHGDEVYAGRQRVGVVTSGTRSPILKKNVALARVAVQYAEHDTKLEVGKLDGLQKRIPATVVRIPFYDPEKTRPTIVTLPLPASRRARATRGSPLRTWRRPVGARLASPSPTT